MLICFFAVLVTHAPGGARLQHDAGQLRGARRSIGATRRRRALGHQEIHAGSGWGRTPVDQHGRLRDGVSVYASPSAALPFLSFFSKESALRIAISCMNDI